VSAYHGSLADAMHIEEEKRVPLARVDGNNSGGSNPGGGNGRHFSHVILQSKHQ
jgi:hypothetical protein